MSSMSKEYFRPRIRTFDEDVDPVGLVKLVAAEYAAMENGYHARLRGVLFRAYTAYELFRAFPDTYDELKQDSFWENSRQKPPKDLTTSRGVLYLIMRATESNDRARATKYAAILDGLSRDRVRPGAVAARIKKMGGVEAAYEAMGARKRRDAKRSQSRVEDEELEENQASSSASDVTDDLFDPEEDLPIRVGRETLKWVLGSEIAVGEAFYLECTKTGPAVNGIRIIGEVVDLESA
jgi:hypothetical protein